MEGHGFDEFDYSEELEPIATEEENVVYQRELEIELEEEEMLRKRFAKEIHLNQWCNCSACSLTLITNQAECFCCQDIDRCREKLEDFEEELPCITQHPGFRSVCLDKWVLETAAIGLKTRKRRSYVVIREQGLVPESRFFRSVAYRQFYRLIWEYDGNQKRLSLPCFVYDAIRSEFPSEHGTYKGFIEEDEEEGETNTDSESEDEELQFDEETE